MTDALNREVREHVRAVIRDSGIATTTEQENGLVDRICGPVEGRHLRLVGTDDTSFDWSEPKDES